MTTAFPGLLEDEEDLQGQALIEALRQQQRRGEAARTTLQQTLGRQQGQAGGLRALSFLSSFGENPLLQNLRQTAGQQGAQLENLAGRTEQRLAGVDGVDLMGIERLRQAAQRMKLQEQEAKRRAGGADAVIDLRKKALKLAEEKLAAQTKRQAEKDAKAPKTPTLPATEAAALGQTDTALTALDDLDAAHAEMAGGLSGGIGALLPGTDASKYDDKVLATAQAVGTILEGGKLAAGDEVKYRKMLPTAGDGPERRKAKIANVKKLLEDKRKGTLKAFGQAGYNMSGFKPQGPERVPAGQAMPKDASGNLTLEDSPAKPAAGMVRVRKGAEVLEIPKEDLAEAKKDGYTQVTQ